MNKRILILTLLSFLTIKTFTQINIKVLQDTIYIKNFNYIKNKSIKSSTSHIFFEIDLNIENIDSFKTYVLYNFSNLALEQHWEREGFIAINNLSYLGFLWYNKRQFLFFNHKKKSIEQYDFQKEYKKYMITLPPMSSMTKKIYIVPDFFPCTDTVLMKCRDTIDYIIRNKQDKIGKEIFLDIDKTSREAGYKIFYNDIYSNKFVVIFRNNKKVKK